MNLPEMSDASMEWSRRAPSGVDLGRDELFEGIVWRRIIAYLIDASIILVIFGLAWMLIILSFGLLSVMLTLFPFVPLTYHTLMIAGPRSATLGMQFMSVEVRGQSGERPSLLQAFTMTAIFYVSVAFTGWLILLVALFNDRRHCAHDYLSGTVVIRTDAAV